MSLTVANNQAQEGVPSYQETKSMRKRKHQACKECRQSKLRCDAPGDDSIPCTRCQDLDQVCEMDRSYKRVNKKLKIDELTAQVQHLQEAFTQKSVSDSLSWDVYDPLAFERIMHGHHLVHTTDSNLRPDPVRSSFSGGHFPFTEPVSTFEASNENLSGEILSPNFNGGSGLPVQSNRVLEDVVLSAEQIDRLFSEYFSHYHRFLAIINPTCPPSQYYEQSPFLFWTIISVAARRFDEEPTLLSSLRASVMNLAWAEIISLSPSIHTIKALLLLCTWPFPISSEASDITPIFIGMAIQLARKLGIHKPQNCQDFSRFKVSPTQDEIHEMVVIWAACNTLAQSYAATSGQSSLFTLDWTIDQACKPDGVLFLPDGLRKRLIIARFGDRVMGDMSGNILESGGIPFETERIRTLQQLHDDIEMIENSVLSKMDSINQIQFCALRLHLESYYFFDLSDSCTRRQGLLRAYSAAMTFITRLLDEDKRSALLSYCSYDLLRVLWQAMQIISDILRSVYASDIDVEAGQRLFHAGVAGAKRASVENNDMPGRLSVIMSQLWRKRNATADGIPRQIILRINSRLGASPIYDWLWHWREEFAGQANAYQSFQDEPVLSNVSELSNELLRSTPWQL